MQQHLQGLVQRTQSRLYNLLSCTLHSSPLQVQRSAAKMCLCLWLAWGASLLVILSPVPVQLILKCCRAVQTLSSTCSTAGYSPLQQPNFSLSITLQTKGNMLQRYALDNLQLYYFQYRPHQQHSVCAGLRHWSPHNSSASSDKAAICVCHKQ